MSLFICHYGCGRAAIKQNKSGNWMCDTSSSKCPEIKRKNSEKTKLAFSSGKRLNQKTLYKNLPEEIKAKMAWSTGLSKESDKRIAKAAKTLSGSMTGKPGRPHSESTKKILSKKRIEFLESKSNHCKWFDIGGIKVQGTLEKNLAEFLVKNSIDFKRVRIKFKNHRVYIPDFYLPEYNIFIEAKGFLYEKDKEKMRLVLAENNIDLRLAFKHDIVKLSTISDLLKLPSASEYIKNIDYSKFKNNWGR
jgi:hypothetical protein